MSGDAAGGGAAGGGAGSEPVGGLVGEHVRVHGTDGTELCGYLYAEDPEDGACVLVQGTDRVEKVHVVQRDFVSSIERTEGPSSRLAAEISGCDDLQALLGGEAEGRNIPRDDATVAFRLNALTSWLTSQQIPHTVREDGRVDLPGGVGVSAPYVGSTCSGSNESVLRRLRSMLEQLG